MRRSLQHFSCRICLCCGFLEVSWSSRETLRWSFEQDDLRQGVLCSQLSVYKIHWESVVCKSWLPCTIFVKDCSPLAWFYRARSLYDALTWYPFPICLHWKPRNLLPTIEGNLKPNPADSAIRLLWVKPALAHSPALLSLKLGKDMHRI